MRKVIYECDGCGQSEEGDATDGPPNGWANISIQRRVSGLQAPGEPFNRHVCSRCDDNIDPKNWTRAVSYDERLPAKRA